jgi:hypothetical protein
MALAASATWSQVRLWLVLAGGLFFGKTVQCDEENG